MFLPSAGQPKRRTPSGLESPAGNNIVEDYVEKLRLDSESTLVYACGHPGMIEDLREKLEPQGFKVKEERYWKQ